MFIDRKSTRVTASIFPFAENVEEAIYQASITVRDGRVWWNGKPVTAQEVFIRYGKMMTAFAKAFEIAEEVKNDES